jgi:hypothetical protein
MKLGPNEQVLTGAWIRVGSEVMGDPVAQRITSLVESHLRELGGRMAQVWRSASPHCRTASSRVYVTADAASKRHSPFTIRDSCFNRSPVIQQVVDGLVEGDLRPPPGRLSETCRIADQHRWIT